MKVENTENNRKIQQVAATMAIEDMYMSKDCLQGLIDVANGTKQGVTEELKATDMMRWRRNLLSRFTYGRYSFLWRWNINASFGTI